MSGSWVCMAAVVVVAALGCGCEGFNIRPSLLGLLQAEEIQKQIDLIESLLGKLVNGSDCSSLEQAKEKNATEESTGMESDDDTAFVSIEGLVVQEKEMKEEEKEEEEKEEEEKEEEEQEEECDYEKIHADHTMLLPPNDECNVTDVGITDEEKAFILSFHNELRSKVAQGNESRGAPGPQPPAANMHQLVWNDELAKVAQAWAAQCPKRHDAEKKRRLCSRTYYTGQNINYFWGTVDEGPRWQRAIENWYNEVQDLDAKFAASFTKTPKKTGHYTQLIWGTSKEIGCGIVYYETERYGFYYNNSITQVCNYGPAGNILNRPLYEHGPAATMCLGNVSMEYPALCI